MSAANWAEALAEIPDGRLAEKPAPHARSAADVAWETILVNRRAARRVRGEDAGPGVGFPPCPPEVASASALTEALRISAEELLTAATDPLKTVVYPGGQESAFAYVLSMDFHMAYHLGQIVYLGTLFEAV